MKKLLSIFLSVLMIAGAISLAGCSSTEDSASPADTSTQAPETKASAKKQDAATKSEKETEDAAKDDNKPEGNEPPKSDLTPQTQAPAETKYGDAEVYENKDGDPVAKTEDGTEVELTGENLQELFAEYEKVKGTGSEKEKEILDKIQLILEASPQMQPAQ